MKRIFLIAIAALFCVTASAQKVEKNEKSEKKKEELTTVTASSLEELLKKINDIMYEAKADSIITEKEKMVGQSFDFTV